MSTPNSLAESLARAYVRESCPCLCPEVQGRASQVLTGLLLGSIAACDAMRLCWSCLGTHAPAQRIMDILSVPPDPLPSPETTDAAKGAGGRQRARGWSKTEEQRLIAGIMRYGTDKWSAIAQFVGSGRTRAQCVQRWNRGLSPEISKGPWTKGEDDRLLDLVLRFGEKSWKQISFNLANRSDVQCRHRY
jgi:hypothetical protein